jgi:hypothetical protein
MLVDMFQKKTASLSAQCPTNPEMGCGAAKHGTKTQGNP